MTLTYTLYSTFNLDVSHAVVRALIVCCCYHQNWIKLDQNGIFISNIFNSYYIYRICILYKYWNVFGHITFCTGRQMNLFIHVEYIIFLICAAVGLATRLIRQWLTASSNVFSLNRSLGSKRNPQEIFPETFIWVFKRPSSINFLHLIY